MGCIVEYKNQIISSSEINLSNNIKLLNSSNFSNYSSSNQVNYKINIIKCPTNDSLESKSKSKRKNKSNRIKVGNLKNEIKEEPKSLLGLRQYQKEFEVKMLAEINRIRKYPFEYANLLENFIKYIIPNNVNYEEKHPNNSYVFAFPNKRKVGLPNGEFAFRKVIDILRNRKPANELSLNSDIKMDVKKLNSYDSENVKYFLSLKKQEIGNVYPNLKFLVDVVNDPKLSALFLLVDDTPFGGKRRENILDENITQFAVSTIEVKSKKQNFSLVSLA